MPLDKARKSHLAGFFGCLATALTYLHDNSIRHKVFQPIFHIIRISNTGGKKMDIKPRKYIDIQVCPLIDRLRLSIGLV